jgi:SAM-dependent methyltransferase
MHRKSCILCGGTSFTPVQLHQEFSDTRILRCETCNLQFTDPIPTAEFLDSLYAQTRWNNKDIDVSATLPASQIRFIQQNVGSYLPSYGKVLDVGCSAGSLLKLFRHAGWNVVGLEPNEEAASHARDKFQLNVQTGTLSTVTFQAQEFDLICLSHVLEHLEDPLFNLQVIRQILKKDGFLFVEVPNEGQGKCYGTTGYHLFFLTPQTLSMLLHKAGFQPVSIVTSGRLLPDHQRLSRMMYSRLGKLMYRIPSIVRLVKYFTGGLLTEHDQLDEVYPTTGERVGATIRGIFKPIAEDGE